MLGVVLIDYYNNNYSSSGFVQIIYLLHLVLKGNEYLYENPVKPLKLCVYKTCVHPVFFIVFCTNNK